MKGRPRDTGHSGFATFTLFTVSFLACFYVAGRLWQDSERRVILMSMLEKGGKGGGKPVTVEDKLQFLGCKATEKRLEELEMELAAARSQGFTNSWVNTNVVNKTGNRPLAVIGVYTEFGNKLKRDAIRRKWMPTGDALKSLEKDKGIVVRFVIGRSANKGDSSDRRIDSENHETKDFLILDQHVEMSEEYANKAKHFFSAAVEGWDADFYVKVDDDVYINIDELSKLLRDYLEKPRAYIGCMKSGEVVSEEGQRWYEKEWWKFGDGKSYYRHAAGKFYIISRTIAQYIYVNRDLLHSYAHEDISVGSWMLGLDVQHIDEKRVCCGSAPKGLYFFMCVIHGKETVLPCRIRLCTYLRAY
ncbi:hypothetical protein KP509_13G098900 [Ceratopteris richardii]|uniref:Hexosyltransferase n=1 Tax=Ceratopteris richardii TaxID=49495 RepID=A0A8T2TLC2_CERRI|nr:hypothetical protein KP509_13G098900 [Ceratopteris richardii]